MPQAAGAESARSGWLAAQAIGRFAELAAGLPVSEERARAILRAMAEGIGRAAATQVAPDLLAAMHARVERRHPSIFCEFARDAAASFGNIDAAALTHPVLAALIEGIKIIDDIQDDEPSCLAAEIGAGAASHVALGAFALALELTAALPFPGAASAEDSWRAATAAIGRGIRETAIGQALEAATLESDVADFDAFWSVTDAKTPPLVATALELGALVAGATPSSAAALTQLAVPLGRLLQIGDDCNDALGPEASDWRTPHLNLLLLYGLRGPRGSELAALLRNAPESLRAAQVWLLREGALAYALHAQFSTLQTLESAIGPLALPFPAALLESVERHRSDSEALLRKSGVDGELAARMARG
jgi:polyprenyl synthetase